MPSCISWEFFPSSCVITEICEAKDDLEEPASTKTRSVWRRSFSTYKNRHYFHATFHIPLSSCIFLIAMSTSGKQYAIWRYRSLIKYWCSFTQKLWGTEKSNPHICKLRIVAANRLNLKSLKCYTKNILILKPLLFERILGKKNFRDVIASVGRKWIFQSPGKLNFNL